MNKAELRRQALIAIEYVTLPPCWEVSAATRMNQQQWVRSWWYAHSPINDLMILTARGGWLSGMVDVSSHNMNILVHYDKTQLAVDHILKWIKIDPP